MSKKTAMVRVDEELHGRVKRLLEQSKLRLDIGDFYEVAVRRMVEDVEKNGLRVIDPTDAPAREACAEPHTRPGPAAGGPAASGARAPRLKASA